MTSLIKNTLVFAGLAGLATFGYYLFVAQGDTVLSVDGTAISTQVQAENQEFLRRLAELQRVEIDQTFFSDPRFLSLRDFSRPAAPEPVGRSNPFAPISSN